MQWYYKQNVAVTFGNGVFNLLFDKVNEINGKKGIIITSRSFAKLGLPQKLMFESKGKITDVFYKVSPNPDFFECQECVNIIKEKQCDFIIAIGGGSVLDCAKAAAAFSTSSIKVESYCESNTQLPTKSLPLIAIPTTAGTGSEVTNVVVLSSSEHKIKKPFSSDVFYPKIALVDPTLTYTMSPVVTACSGLDVFCHALEAYWHVNHYPIGDSLAIHALKLVLLYLPIAYKEPKNALAREKMAEASLIAGLSFAIQKTTSAHACSYPLTNIYHIPHGEACALTIDYFLRINGKPENDKNGHISNLINELGYYNEESFADAIQALKKDLGLRLDLSDFNLSDEQIEELVKQSMHPNLKNNPVEISEEILRSMYNSFR
ncbi:MAG: iron-containing alcohol dehydrogenase family protein [Succinivibrionaceae bacterium]